MFQCRMLSNYMEWKDKTSWRQEMRVQADLSVKKLCILKINVIPKHHINTPRCKRGTAVHTYLESLQTVQNFRQKCKFRKLTMNMVTIARQYRWLLIQSCIDFLKYSMPWYSWKEHKCIFLKVTFMRNALLIDEYYFKFASVLLNQNFIFNYLC